MSSSSLYGNVSNVTVSSKNLTTLYNASTGNTVVANVPDRNFTTLYSKNQAQINPSKSYGNSNVEAFLNSGTDGANSVQNIVMSGNITVGGSSNLGNVGNVHITGGTSGYILATDGLGHLNWIEGIGNESTIPYIHFDVTSDGTNQVFTDSNIGLYSSDVYLSVFKNGVNLEPSQYSISGDDLTISILLLTGDTIDVLPQGGRAANTQPAGIYGEVQFNGGLVFEASSEFTFDPSSNLLTIANIVVSETTTLGDVSTVHIGGGTNGQVLTTNGSNTLSWSTSVGNANYANFSGTSFSVSGSNVSGAVNLATYATTANAVAGANVSGQVSFAAVANSVAGANVSGYVPNAVHANVANVANAVSVANVTGIGNIATVNLTGSSSNVLYGNGVFTDITSLGTLTTLTVSGNANLGNLQLNKYEEIVYSIGTANGTITPDFNNGSIQSITLNGSLTLDSLGNAIAGRSMTLIITQDASGNRTMSSTMKFAGGSKTLSTLGNSVDIISVFYTGSVYYATLSKGYS